jgi:nucleotide-binding universal stress UspA family protein
LCLRKVYEPDKCELLIVDVMISKVLVAFDGSKYSLRALDFALELADKYSAEVVVLHVFEPPVFADPENLARISMGEAELIRDLRKSHEIILENARELVSEKAIGIKVQIEMREGSPASQIVSAAKEGKFDIIVIGHGGKGRTGEMLLGGTSERVAHLAECPVLIVK